MLNYYHHDREQLGFYKKAYVKTGGKKKHVRVLQVNETKNKKRIILIYLTKTILSHTI